MRNANGKGILAGALIAAQANFLGSCDRKPSATTTAPIRVVAEKQSSGAPAVDWTTVTPTADGSEVVAYKAIARYCDFWHQGRTPAITLRFVPPSSFIDDAGHSADFGTQLLSAQIWKGITRSTKGPRGEPKWAVASKSDVYKAKTPGLPGDDFGTLPRYKYSMEVLDDGTLCFHNLGKYDDGE